MELEIFAANLRALRQKAGLSQEALAVRLGVSAQSVSKWENAANWPEAALLLPLARLLGVTADELLEDPTARRELWEKRWKAAFSEGRHAEALAAAEEALAAMPEDREFRFRQANGEYQTAALTADEGERNKLLRAAEKHFAALLRDCPDFEEAGVMLVQTLLGQGKRKEAEALAQKLPRREKTELVLRRGKARETALRREITKTAVELLNLLQSDGSEEACSLTEAILSAAGEPKAFLWYALNLRLQRARLRGERGESEGAMAALEELVNIARSYVPPGAPEEAGALFDSLPAPPSPPEVWLWVREALALDCFAALRAHPGFPGLEREAEGH